MSGGVSFHTTEGAGFVSRGDAAQLRGDGWGLDFGLFTATAGAFQQVPAGVANGRRQRLIAGRPAPKANPNDYAAGPGPSRFHGGFVGQGSVAVTETLSPERWENNR